MGVSLAFFAGVAALSPAGLFQARQGPGAFYTVIPYVAMVVPALALSLYAVGVMLAGAFAFARDIRGKPRDYVLWPAVFAAAGEALGLRYLRGGTAGGCTYPTDRPSNTRLVLHMLVFYGFLVAFVATVSAFILQDIFDQLPPYPILSVPVILGTLGGLAMIVGAAGLLALKARSDRAPADAGSLKLDPGVPVQPGHRLGHGPAAAGFAHDAGDGQPPDHPPGDGAGALRVCPLRQVRPLRVPLRGAGPEPPGIGPALISTPAELSV